MLVVLLILLVTGYCYHKHLESKNWLEDQRQFYFQRTWWWTHHPEEFEEDRIHFNNEVKTHILTPDEVRELFKH